MLKKPNSSQGEDGKLRVHAQAGMAGLPGEGKAGRPGKAVRRFSFLWSFQTNNISWDRSLMGGCPMIVSPPMLIVPLARVKFPLDDWGQIPPEPL
jgi:hypothetical protein